MARAIVAAAGIALLLTPATGSAQDAHYWSQQYGTRSELLGGTVVGSPQDLSTTYYNPGGLAFLENQSFLLSALALQFEQYQLGSAAGGDSELGADRFGPAPILVAGTLPRHWIDGTLAYSYLSRQQLEARIDSWETLGSAPDAPVANLLLDARVSENWGGLTWSRVFGSIGVGGSVYGAYRSQRGREELLTQPIPTGVPSSAIATVDDYSYWHMRALAKLGVHWEGDGASLGLAYTTPGLPLFGGGEASFYRSVQSDSVGLDINEAVIAEEPSVTYRSPMSVSVGSRIEAGRAAFYLTAEWFDAVAPYRVVTAGGIPGSGLGSSLGALLYQESESVVNLGVGAEFTPRERLTLFASFITDYSSANENPATGHSFATWDIYQGTAGAAFSLLQADFTLGLSMGRGSEPLQRVNDVDGTSLLPGGKVSYKRWKIFLGFEFS
jgi:hypothetical protein